MYKSSSAKLYWKGTKKGCKKELPKGAKILVNKKTKERSKYGGKRYKIFLKMKRRCWLSV